MTRSDCEPHPIARGLDPEITPTSELVFLDYETRSPVDLLAAGSWVYAQHQDTQLIALAVADGVTGQARSIKDPNSYRLPPGSIGVSASLFDERIYRLRASDGEEMPWIDLFQVAAYLGRLGNLDRVAAGFNLGSKLSIGKDLIRTFCRPQVDGTFLEISPNIQDKIDAYCRQDVRLLQDLWRLIGPAYPLWRRDWGVAYSDIQRMNSNGLPVDRDAAVRAVSRIEEERVALTDRLIRATDGRIKKISSTKVAGELGLPDGKEKTLVSARFDDPDKEEIRQVRLAGGSSAVAKLPKIIAHAAVDGRVHDGFISNGTQTGRMNSIGVQLLNLPRGRSEIDGELFDALATGSDIDLIGLRVRDAIRQFFCAPDGFEFVVADFSSVEVRVMATLASERRLLDWFGRCIDPYLAFASEHFGREITDRSGPERRFGKLAVLGAQYGVSPKGLAEQAPDYGIHDLTAVAAAGLLRSYSKLFPKILEYWRFLERAAINAVRVRGQVYSHQGIEFESSADFLCMRLWSGRVIRYPRPLLERGTVAYHKNGKLKRRLWHGQLANNVCQATAADLQMAALRNVTAAGLEVVAAFHDEIVVLAPIDQVRPENLCALLTSGLPEWASLFPLEAEGFASVRYRKN
jgi:DNA polymerase